jgi:hypothetical protein
VYVDLQTARTELRAKSPRIAPRAIVAEILVVVSISFMLVGFFA